MIQETGGGLGQPDVLDALGRLLQVLFVWLGPNRTLGLIAAVVIVLAVRRRYYDQQKDRDSDRLYAEMERTIQRIASQERAWRHLFVTRFAKLTDEEADRLVNRNEYITPKEAREDLERPPGERE